MKKILLFLGVLLTFSFNVVKGEVTVERNIYSSNGSMKFIFSGLEINEENSYQFGLVSKKSDEIETWFDINELTESTLTANVSVTNSKMLNVINKDDKGYISIRNTTNNNEVILDDYAVDLKIPYLRVTNYMAVSSGFDFNENEIKVPLRNPSYSTAYYKIEKITDEELIKKYKEIKDDDYSVLEDYIKNVPASGYSPWAHFNGHGSLGVDYGYGYPYRVSDVTFNETGLYYLWLYFADIGKADSVLKDMYGVIILDNLEKEILLTKISIPSSRTLELGKTLTLTPEFTPSNATNRNHTWTSSDESVATVSNAGVVTAVKEGQTTITVTSEFNSNIKSECLVTVTNASNSLNTETNKEQTTDKKYEDQTTENPKTGIVTYLIISIGSLGLLVYGYVVVRKKVFLKKF